MLQHRHHLLKCLAGLVLPGQREWACLHARYALGTGGAASNEDPDSDQPAEEQRGNFRTHHCFTISTRRFCARPAAVVFGAARFVSPSPLVVIRLASTLKSDTSVAFTAAARASLNVRFVAGDPTLSVCPSIRILRSPYFFNVPAISLSTGRDSGCRSAFPVANKIPWVIQRPLVVSASYITSASLSATRMLVRKVAWFCSSPPFTRTRITLSRRNCRTGML